MKAKKVLAMLMASAMIMGTSVTAFAATGEIPSENDTAEITIDNLDPGATVKAYQIIDGEYVTGQGFKYFVWNIDYDSDGDSVNDIVKGTKVNDPENEITEEMIKAIAANPLAYGLTEVDITNNKNLTVGTWMIIAESDDAEKVYNPMLASVYYSVNEETGKNEMATADVDANDRWDLAGTPTYAKSTTIDIQKEVDPDQEDAALYESVEFTISGTIPSYGSQYGNNIKYVVTDTFVNGLTMNEIKEGDEVLANAQDAPEVYVGGSETPLDTQCYDYDKIEIGDQLEDGTVATKEGFKITFDSDYIQTLVNYTEVQRGFQIVYHATVTQDAITEVGENKVELDYTNKPNTDSGKDDDTEYVATYEFNGILKKIGEGNDANGLDGAQFTIATNPEFTENVQTMTTQEGEFDIEFKGLDGDLTYYLKETKAPDGYSLNTDVYMITFSNQQYDKNGKLLSYQVNIAKQGDGEYHEVANITYGQESATIADTVLNTKMSSLPSTGGIGTTIFTIGGCVIMVTAAGLYFATRKKEQN